VLRLPNADEMDDETFVKHIKLRHPALAARPHRGEHAHIDAEDHIHAASFSTPIEFPPDTGEDDDPRLVRYKPRPPPGPSWHKFLRRPT